MVAPRPLFSRSLLVGLVAALLAVHAWLAISATFDLGVTADETAHLTAGYSYWKFNDYRLQPENGNLPQRWAALPLLPAHPRLDPWTQTDAWQRSNIWLVGQRFFFESGNSIDWLLLLARSAMVCWSLATGLLVFFWARHLWGAGGALLSLALFAWSPTTLAHAPLVTSDMCAAFCLLAATGAWWRVSGRITPGWLVVSLLAAGLAAVAKFSSVLLLPVGVLLAAWRVFDREPVLVALRRGRIHAVTGGRRKARLLAGLGMLHVLAAIAIIWACFGFRFGAFAPGLPPAAKFFSDWSKTVAEIGLWQPPLTFAHAHHLLPEAYLQGFAFVIWAAQERGAFLVGQFSLTGWWWFFPFAFLVKSTLAELFVAVALPVLGLVRQVRAGSMALLRHLAPLAPLFVFAAVYGGASLASHLNIGHRHILPLYPVLFILAGALVPRLGQHWGPALATGLAILAAGEAWAIRPDFLAYFNRLAGGPDAGWRLLVDSSLDWGQNLPRLAEWLKTHRHPGEPVYLSMFGTDDPYYRGIDALELSPNYSFGRHRRWLELQPGWYCVSASMLQDVYSPYAGPWTLRHELDYQTLLRVLRAEMAAGTRRPDVGEFGKGPERLIWNLDRARFARLCLYLRVRPPDATIGHTILLYRLSADETRLVVDGSLTELAHAMATVAKRRQGN